MEIDYRIVNLLTIFRYKNKKEKIEQDEDILYSLANEYLEQNKANKKFLNKPAVVERIKRIIFENLLLGENTKFSQNGSIVEQGDNYKQVLGVLSNGSIIFVREYEGKKRITSFDLYDDEPVCRYLEYKNNDYLSSEIRIMIDEYGFDSSYYDSTDIVDKYREKFKHLITSIVGSHICGIADKGGYSISSEADSYFLDRELKSVIRDDINDEDLVDEFEYDDINEMVTAFPEPFLLDNDTDVQQLNSNLNYLRARYPNVDEWFVNRFGKEFLINKGIILETCPIEEDDRKKILNSRESELVIEFGYTKLSYEKASEYVKVIYKEEQDDKAYIFLRKMTDEELIKFLQENPEFSLKNVSEIIGNIKDDSLKLEKLGEYIDEFEIEEIIRVVKTLKDEDTKVMYFEKYFHEILEHDSRLVDDFSDEFNDEFDEEKQNDNISKDPTLSDQVLSSLSKKENLYRFLQELKQYAKIRYQYIKDFSKEEILEILDGLEDVLLFEDYIEVFKTEKFSDEDILNVLKNNWEEYMDIVDTDKNDLIPYDEQSTTFKVIALQYVNDDNKKAEFMKEHEEDFGADEITAVLQSFEEQDKIIELAERYELPTYYYQRLIIMCSDDKKFEYLDAKSELGEEDVMAILTSVDDMPKVFQYVEQREDFDVMEKLRILSEVETEIFDDREKIVKVKLDFLNRNKKAILENINTREELDTFYKYLRDCEVYDPKEKQLIDGLVSTAEKRFQDSNGGEAK